ncbi:hypothetical protein ACOMHN_034596 [Nucella lapillus]
MTVSVVKGQEVRWIESKAYFGDYDWFYRSRKQFEDYLRLFGPGLVVYWYGYIKPLGRRLQGVAVSDSLPKAWKFLNQKPVSPWADKL